MNIALSISKHLGIKKPPNYKKLWKRLTVRDLRPPSYEFTSHVWLDARELKSLNVTGRLSIHFYNFSRQISSESPCLATPLDFKQSIEQPLWTFEIGLRLRVFQEDWNLCSVKTFFLEKQKQKNRWKYWKVAWVYFATLTCQSSEIRDKE